MDAREFHSIPNPYSTGTPTYDSKMFYGRDKDIHFLAENLTRNVKSVIVLYGQRRSGKTTLLLQLVNTPLLEPHIPVLIDLQKFAYNATIENVLRRLAYDIARAIKKKGPAVSLPDSNTFMLDPTHAFDLFLDQIEEQLAERKLILLIDEFEVLEELVIRGHLQPEIFAYLRNIVQHRQHVHFLFSGTHKITAYTKWYRSVFFNIAHHYRLSQLSPQGAEDLIKNPVEGYLAYEPLTVQKIRQLTADQPYLIHLICRAIVDHCNEQRKNYVTLNDLNLALRPVMQTGWFHFDWLWDQINPEGRLVLAALAEGGREEGRWLLFTEIEELCRRHHAASYKYELLDALKTLIEADIIEERPDNSRKSSFDTNHFRIPVGLTRSWLLKEHPLELVGKEMQ